MSQVLICSTCREIATEDTEYYALDSVPTASNDISLKEMLLYCVPEFEEILNDDGTNSWICSVCCQALRWAYSFRKMCLDVRNKLEIDIISSAQEVAIHVAEEDLGDEIESVVADDAIKTDIIIEDDPLEMDFIDTRFCVKEEQLEVEETNLIDIKSELEEIEPVWISDDDCLYTLVEIEEAVPPDVQSEELALIESACKNIPQLKEKNITPDSFKCHINIEPLKIEQTKQMTKKRRKRRGFRLQQTKHRTKDLKAFICLICSKRFTTSILLNKHLKTQHDTTETVAHLSENVCDEPNCEKKKSPNLPAKQKSSRQQIESTSIDPVTTKFQNLDTKKRFLKPKRTRKAMPKVLSEPKRKKGNIPQDETELLREAVSNLTPNGVVATDFCESAPLYPTSESTRIDSEMCVVGKDVLGDNMLSVLKEYYPNAVMLLPPPILLPDLNKINKQRKSCRRKKQHAPQNRRQAKTKRRIPPLVINDKTSTLSSINSDHTYSLSSRNFGEKCLECGCTFNTVELFNYHVDNYHAGWFLHKEASTKVKSMVLEDLCYKTMGAESYSADSDLEEELEHNKRSEIDEIKNREKSDSETDPADDDNMHCNDFSTSNVHVAKTAEQDELQEIDKNDQLQKSVLNLATAEPVKQQHTNNEIAKNKVIVHDVQVFNILVNTDQQTLETAHPQTSGSKKKVQCPKRSKKRKLKPARTGEIKKKKVERPKDCTKEF